MPKNNKEASPKATKETLKSLRAQLELAREDLKLEIGKRVEQWEHFSRAAQRDGQDARKSIASAHEMFAVATTQFEVLATSLSLLNRLSREAEKKAWNAFAATRKRWFASAPKVEAPIEFNEIRESLSLIAKLLEESQRRAAHFAQAFAAAKNPNICNMQAPDAAELSAKLSRG